MLSSVLTLHLLSSKISSDPYSPSSELLSKTRAAEGTVTYDGLHRIYDDKDSKRYWKGDVPYEEWAKRLKGKPTIGYGTRYDQLDPRIQEYIRSRKGINSLLAEHYLKRHYMKQEAAIRNTYKDKWDTLNDNQRDALRSFHYNTGAHSRPESIMKALRDNRPDLVPDGMKLWNKANGKVSPGLVNRRQMEVDWYNRPVGQPSPTPKRQTPSHQVKSLKQRLEEAPIKSFP